jgi:hypothetical protein
MVRNKMSYRIFEKSYIILTFGRFLMEKRYEGLNPVHYPHLF